MVKFNGINHLAFVTGNMDATIRFWRDLLGLRLVAGLGDGKKYRHYFFELSETDMIAFFEWPEAKKIDVKDHGVPVNGKIAFDHVSLGVDNDDALWELKDRLGAAGFWVSEVIDHGFIHSIYSFDPNHIPIEFSADVRGIDLRLHPKMKDKKPSPASEEGAEPRLGHWPEKNGDTPESEKILFPGEGRILVDDDNKA